MKKRINYRGILPVFLVLFLFINFIKTSLADFSVATVELKYSSSIWRKNDYINLNGAMAHLLSMKGLYSNIGMYITDENYIVSASGETSTDYEYNQLIAFKDFLAANNINLLFVNEPTKYIDDSIFRQQFGVESYSNRNMDLFLHRIREAGINALDLRDIIIKEKINISYLFYRTDHHWTVPAALWATGKIAQALNEYCGYGIDTAIYDFDNYDVKKWKNCWLGEQGRKVGKTYVGLDDYTEMKPSFDTDFTFINSENGTPLKGNFESFISESVFNPNNDVYTNDSWHYAYKAMNNIINHNISEGTVLLLGDSYDRVTQPFLALGIHAVDFLCLRDIDFDLRDYILQHNYDTVIVAYAQFMLGAHDDPASANYDMYSFLPKSYVLAP